MRVFALFFIFLFFNVNYAYQFLPGYEYPIGNSGAYIMAGVAKIKRVDKPYRFAKMGRSIYDSQELVVGSGIEYDKSKNGPGINVVNMQ